MRSLLVLMASLVDLAWGLGTASLSTTLLHFDDLSPPKEASVPIYAPPALYRQLHITGFSVFEPQSTALAPILLPADRSCAVSAPNALLGSIRGEPPMKPAFEIAGRSSGDRDADESEEIKNKNTFDLLGMSMKPLSAPPGPEETTIFLKGYPANASIETLHWHVDFPMGWHVPFTPTLPSSWKALRKVEMWAEYGPDKLDWEFCVDDLRLQWRDSTVQGDTWYDDDGEQGEL